MCFHYVWYPASRSDVLGIDSDGSEILVGDHHVEIDIIDHDVSNVL